MEDYPSDDELRAIATAMVVNRGDCADVLDRVVERWVDYGSAIVEGDTYTFITGGWSGNEDLIQALQANMVLQSLCWQSSHRGGKHVYALPESP